MNVLRSFAFFCKRMKRSRILLWSLQKNEMFSAFFYVLCKRMLHSLRSFMFLRKECKSTHCSFGSHKSPKTRKKNVLLKERCVQNGKERGAQPCLMITAVRSPSLMVTVLYVPSGTVMFHC